MNKYLLSLALLFSPICATIDFEPVFLESECVDVIIQRSSEPIDVYQLNIYPNAFYEIDSIYVLMTNWDTGKKEFVCIEKNECENSIFG